MARVVFLLYHGIGHFNPCFRLAKILQAQNDVIFVGHIFFESYVKNHGYNFHALKTVPFGMGFETWVNTIEGKKNIFCHSLRDRWKDRLYVLRKDELYHLVNEIKPDYLFIDSAQATDFIVLYPVLKSKKVKTAIIHANLATEVEKDIPPLNSPQLPDGLSSVKQAHRIFFLKQIKKTFWQSIKYLGKSNMAIVKKQILSNRIPKQYISDKPALFGLAIDHIDQFIMAPIEIEFPSAHRSSLQHYIGFMIDVSRSETADEKFNTLIELLKEKVSGGSRILYCSFGTVQYDDLKKVDGFLKKLITFISATNDVLIIAGNAHTLFKNLRLPSNIFIFKSVPHFKLFPFVSLFITHGGFNSVKESIHSGVPLLVYPVDPRTDQNGNAARIVYHQLGLRGNLSGDSENEIREKIDELLMNPAYKIKIEKLKKIDETYTEEIFLDLFKNIKPLD